MNSENLKDITSSTAVRDFPEKYNTMKNELISEIERLNGIIASRNNEIQTLKNELNLALGKLKADYESICGRLANEINTMKDDFNDALNALDQRYVKKDDFNDALNALDDKFIKKETNS